MQNFSRLHRPKQNAANKWATQGNNRQYRHDSKQDIQNTDWARVRHSKVLPQKN